MYQLTKADRQFRSAVESAQFPVSDFNHRAHLRLAYVYLADTDDVPHAVDAMRKTLLGLLEHAGVDPAEKYHETMTEAWILAVHHFMNEGAGAQSADDFIDQNPDLLDANIMLTHYSHDLLFSAPARQAFVQPDLDAIPRHC